MAGYSTPVAQIEFDRVFFCAPFFGAPYLPFSRWLQFAHDILIHVSLSQLFKPERHFVPYNAEPTGSPRRRRRVLIRRQSEDGSTDAQDQRSLSARDSTIIGGSTMDIKIMKVPDLKRELEEKGVSTQGVKSDLIARLEQERVSYNLV